MEILAACALFVIVTVSVTWLGLNFWARPKEALDRVISAQVERQQEVPVHPSLALRDFLSKIGNLLPASPKDVNLMQRQLIRAGIRSASALRLLYGSKILLAILFPLAMSFAVSNSDAAIENKVLAIAASAAAGFWGPNEYVKLRSRRRQREVKRGLPNALDLMVVCVESGLGLDQAILQVARELQHAHPEISEEFGFVNLELKAGKRRIEALRNLTERTNVEELKKLVAVLIQADRFGTGVAASLRGHADYMRVQSRQEAEEKAAKLGVKLIFPIFFCILPSLFIVTVGPVAVKIMRELIPMLNGET
jgi:tight adherence protein C